MPAADACAEPPAEPSAEAGGDEGARADPVIELRGLTVRFGDITAVDGVSLQVQREELLMLLGGSGSGKTTTLESINRLVEPAPGMVRLDGRDVLDLVPHELRRRVGYCFQDVGLFPHLTVAANVGITPRLLRWPPARIRAQVDALLAAVELEPSVYRDRMPDTLSGGQRQRVGVARALAAEPEVVLFDEPFGALDPITKEQVWDAFGRLRAQLGFAAVFVTHDVIEALALGDRIAVLRDGRLLASGTAGQLRRGPADGYVRRLLDAPFRAARRAELGEP